MGDFQFSGTLTSEQEDWLLTRRTYVQMETNRNSLGEIRGQVGQGVVVPEPSSMTLVCLSVLFFGLMRRSRETN